MNNLIFLLNNLNLGGVQLEALAIAKELKNERVIKVFSGSEGNISDKFKLEEIDLHCFNSESSKLNINEIFRLKRELKKISSDHRPVIVSFSIKHTFILSIFNILNVFKSKLIYRHSGLIVHTQLPLHKIFLNYIIEFINLLGSSKIICVSEQNSEFLKKIFPFKKRILFCPTHYETTKFRNRVKEEDSWTLRNRLNIKPDAFVAVCPLSFVPNKNQHLILKIAEEIKPKLNHPIYWCFCGAGEELNNFKNLVNKSSVKNDIIIKGRVDEIELYISGANIIVSASTYMEGLPQIYSQANYTNTPIVAFDWAGAQDEIKNGENGYLIKHFNLNQFKKRVLDVYFKKSRFKDNFALYNYDHDHKAIKKFIKLISD